MPCYSANTFLQSMTAELLVISLFRSTNFAGRLCDKFTTKKAYSYYSKEISRFAGINFLPQVENEKEHKNKSKEEQLKVAKSRQNWQLMLHSQV